MPTNAQYAIHSGANLIHENVSDFKRGIVEEKTVRQKGRADRQSQRRQTIAEKRMELDKAGQVAESVMKAGTAKATTPIRERPVAMPAQTRTASQAASRRESSVKERPAASAREQAQPTKIKEPVSKSPEQRIQAVRQSAPAAMKKDMPPTAKQAEPSARQTIPHQKQTKTTQKKNVSKSNVAQSTNRKGGKK